MAKKCPLMCNMRTAYHSKYPDIAIGDEAEFGDCISEDCAWWEQWCNANGPRGRCAVLDLAKSHTELVHRQ